MSTANIYQLIKEFKTQGLKELKGASGKGDTPSFSKDELEKISRLMDLISDGIEPEEISSIISLLGSISGVLGSDVTGKIVAELKEVMKKMVEDQLKDLSPDVQKDLASKILESVMNVLMDKIHL